MSDGDGELVERYEYDVYGAATIYDGGGVTLTVSAIGNPYLFTGRRYDAESGNYYYRARVYSPALGRFLSVDPLGFDAGDYNLYRYVGNNPATLTDPTGEFAFVPWLLKVGGEMAADALMQAVIHYYFDPNITTIEQAINSIDVRQVFVAGGTALLPGGRLVQSLAGAFGDVTLYILDALEQCRQPDLETILRTFGVSFVVEIGGSYLGDLVAKYGTIAVSKGLKKLGLDELAEKVLRQVDNADNIEWRNRSKLDGPGFERWLQDRFGGELRVRHLGREFDLEKGDLLIEAKSSWDWLNKAGAWENFASTTGQQRAIAQQLGKRFELHSQGPVPERVRDWLRRKRIDFVEH